jgi:hypothetical protein
MPQARHQEFELFSRHGKHTGIGKAKQQFSSDDDGNQHCLGKLQTRLLPGLTAQVDP